MPTPYKRQHVIKKPDGTTRSAEYWRATWTDPEGSRHQVNLGNCAKVSEREANRRLMDAMAKTRRPLASHVTVADWTQDCIDRLTTGPSSVKQYEIARRQAVECWGAEKRMRSVTTADVERFMAYVRAHRTIAGQTVKATKPTSDYTVRNRVVSLASMFERATVYPSRAKPLIPFNPFDDAQKPNPKEGGETQYVPVMDGLELLRSAPDWNHRTLIALTRFMAMRYEDATSAEVTHVDHPRQSIAVPLRENQRGKGRSTKQAWRLVPMSKAVYHIVSKRIAELPPGVTRLVDESGIYKGARGSAARTMRRFRGEVLDGPIGKPFHDLRMSQADDWSLLHGVERSAKWCGHGIDVAVKHYRKKGHDDLALVTGKGDPRATLLAEYEELDRVVLAW